MLAAARPAPARRGRRRYGPRDEDGKLLFRTRIGARQPAVASDDRCPRRMRRRIGTIGLPRARTSLAIALSYIPSGPLTLATFGVRYHSPCGGSIASTPTSNTTAAQAPAEPAPAEPDDPSARILTARRTSEEEAEAHGPQAGGCDDDHIDDDDMDNDTKDDNAIKGTAKAEHVSSTTALAPSSSSSSHPDATAVFVLLIDATSNRYELLAVARDADNATVGDYILAATKQSVLPISGFSSCFRIRTPGSPSSSAGSSLRVRVLTRRGGSNGAMARLSERAMWSLPTPSTGVSPREVLVGIPPTLSASQALHLARKVLFKAPHVASILAQPATGNATPGRNNNNVRPSQVRASARRACLPTEAPKATDQSPGAPPCRPMRPNRYRTPLVGRQARSGETAGTLQIRGTSRGRLGEGGGIRRPYYCADAHDKENITAVQ